MRLLYVALTRAQSWLIVAAAGNLASQKDNKTEKDPAWYDLIRAGAERMGAVAGSEGRLVHEFGDWPEGKTVSDMAESAPEAPLPAWLRQPAPEALRPAKPLSPSALGGAKVLFGEGEGEPEMAKERGTALHLLLEHLPDAPQADWPMIARGLIADDGLRDALLAEAARVITAPALASVFAAEALTEVAVTAEYQGERLVGTIDRLIVTPDRVLAVDYKSNQIVPDHAADVPEGLLRQMRAYASALRQIYPDRRVETAILWTRSASLMVVD